MNTLPSPSTPSTASPERNPPPTSCATAGTRATCPPIPPKMRIAWVTTNRPKIGARIVTDSRTPRRLSTTSTPMTSASTSSLEAAAPGGRTLNTWSAPLAIETEMVST